MQSVRSVVSIAVVCVVLGVDIEAASVKKVDLKAGYEEGAVISRPVLDASAVGPIEIANFREAYNKKEHVFRRKKSAWTGGGAKLTIDKKLDLGVVFADALRAEAPKMGLAAGTGGWKIGGEIREIYLDNSTPSAWSMGVLLFYTSMTVKFELQSPTGERLEHTQRLLGYFVAGGKVVNNALAGQMVFAAQDALARLNLGVFKAPTHAGVAKMIEELRPKRVGDAKDLARMIGLSGSRDALSVILDKLGTEKDAGDRTFLVEALAALASPDALDTLSARYATEDPDNRLATLKVFEYIGSEDARRRAGAAFDKEPDAYLKQLAREVADGVVIRGPLKKS
jgi:hypothetical protein